MTSHLYFLSFKVHEAYRQIANISSRHLYLGRIPHQPRAGIKYPSMFSPQMEANCVYYPSNLYGNARLLTEVEVNRGGYLPSRENWGIYKQ